MEAPGWTRPVGSEFRNDYWRSLDWNVPFGVERPMAMSPAAAAQEHYSQTSLWFRFISQWQPWQYTNYHDESMSFHDGCYLGDWSGLPKLEASGPDAVKFLSAFCANSFARFDVGQVKHSIQTNESGKVTGEGVLVKLADDVFRYSGGGAYWLKEGFASGDWDASAELVNPDVFVFAIQGPTSIDVVEAVLGHAVRDLGFSRACPVSLDGQELLLVRSGVSGELGYEFHGPAEAANSVWTAVAEAGRDHGLRQLGGRSQIVSHVEHGFATMGRDYWPGLADKEGAPSAPYRLRPVGGSYEWTDLTEFNRSPVELGWRGSVSTDHEYVGSAVLAAEKRDGTAQILVGLDWNGADVVDIFAAQFREGPLYTPFEMPRSILNHWLNPDQVLVNGRLVGCSTSRAYSTHLRRMISLAVIDRDLAAPGTEVTVLWGDRGTPQREIRAEVVSLPRNPDNRRTDVTQLPSRFAPVR